MSNQSLKQASVRSVTGTALDYNGDWSALFDSASISAGDFNGRFLAWINQSLGAAYDNLPGAMQAFAVSQGFANWDSMGTFSPGGGGGVSTGLLQEASLADFLMLEDGTSYLLQEA